MKKLWIIVALGLTLATTSCEKQEDKVLNPPSSKLAGINDEWVLQSVSHYDPADKEREMLLDISELFIDKNIEMNINSTDFTYSFNTSNPLYFGTNGFWSFDNNEAPSKITFGTVGSNNDTTLFNCKLIRTIRAIDQSLEFELTRFCESGTPTNIYQFKFLRK